VSQRRPPPRAGRGPAGLAPAFEGPEALTELLARAGSPHDAAEAARRFAEAQAAGEARSAAIPALFPSEPRFASPEEARRLYANLFGLWERVAAGAEPARLPVAARAREEGPPLPERGAEPEGPVSRELVEAAWRHLDALPPREARGLRARFEAEQPDLVAWLAAVDLPVAGDAAALDLVHEAWAVLDRARGDRLGTARWQDLAAMAKEPPPLETGQPALAAYAAEQLDLLADEDAAFGPEERAQVERLLATAVGALERASAPPPGAA
jgi:hypothetical protein